MTIEYAIALALGWFCFFAGKAYGHHSASDAGKKEKLPDLKLGSRWNLRGHDGEIVQILGGKEKVVYFSHDVGGDHQVVPVAYFAAVAQPIMTEWN